MAGFLFSMYNATSLLLFQEPLVPYRKLAFYERTGTADHWMEGQLSKQDDNKKTRLKHDDKNIGRLEKECATSATSTCDHGNPTQ